MRSLIWRELIVATRVPAVWAATSVYVLVLAAMLLTWSDGIPVMSGSTFEQFAQVQWLAAALFAPWVACRLAEPWDEIASLAALTAREPSQFVLARACSSAIVLQMFVCAGIPLSIVAAAVGDAGVAHLAPLIGMLSALGVLSAISVTVASSWMHNRMGAWLAATGIVVIAAAVAGRGAAPAAACLVTGALLLAVVAAHENRTHRLAEMHGERRA